MRWRIWRPRNGCWRRIGTRYDPRMKKLLLVDFENVPKVDLAALPADVTVPFFFGASQRTVPTAFLKNALKLGERFVPIDIEGQGKNALDFHIAFYLGEYLQAAPGAECIILSRDKGFDPLVKHLLGRGFKVGRVGAIGDAFVTTPVAAPTATRARTPRVAGAAATTRSRAAKKTAPATATTTATSTLTDLERAKAQLRKMPSKNLPRRRPRLAAMLSSYFARKLDAGKIDTLIDELIDSGAVQESAGSLNYPKP